MYAIRSYYVVYDIVPEMVPFDYVNKVLDKKSLANLIDRCYRLLSDKATVLLADALRTFGYKYSTIAGISIGIDDMHIPTKKKEILDVAEAELKKIVITSYSIHYTKLYEFDRDEVRGAAGHAGVRRADRRADPIEADQRRRAVGRSGA